ncbi:MAG: alpha/beta hydrolase [Rhodospirillales bacterium]|nr:alpha/beta hydrolase [Rhodospirillales bacterium]
MAAAFVVGLRLAGLVAAAALLAACGHGGLGRDATAAGIAQAGGLEAGTSKGAAFDLQIHRRDDGKPGPLFVYIEGDGLAYLDARTPSADPTPLDPLALRLAAADPGPAVLYLGRPCQFAPGRADPRCGVRAWTTGRFAADVVTSVDDAIGRERLRRPERALVLVGYSGGGVIAALVAARRSDVALLVTVAAPLDVADWTRRLGLSPLAGSEHPLDHAERLSTVRQVAFAGRQDKTVPVASIESAVARFGLSAKLIVVPDFDHRCCWVRDWPHLRKVASGE